MPLVLGADSSTQSTKVEVRDADDGTLVAAGSAPHPPVGPPRSEQDPEAWWLALAEAVGAALGPSGARTDDVAAVSVAGQQHGMVLLGRGDRVLRPAKLWNDTESAPQATALVEALGPAEWARRTGSVPVAAFTVTKLAWVAAHQPDVLAATRRVLLPHDWLTLRLGGRAVTDRGDASGTGYYSPADGRWLPELLDTVVGAGPWAHRLPEVLGPTEAAGGVSPEAVATLGLAPGTVVGPGTGDNMAAALALALDAGRPCVSLGTSGTVYLVSDRPTADPSGAVAGFASADGRFLPLVCTLNATRVTDAVARLLGVDAAGLDALALAGSSGAGGVVLVPYFDGERTPDRPTATGSVRGLRGDVAREDLARAAVEGVVCGLLDALDALASTTPVAPGPLVLLGGGARSAAYRRVVADLSGRPLVLPAVGEAVATGACVQAAATLHARPPADIQRAWGLGGGVTVEPGPGVDRAAVRAAYAAARG